ncbi:hypothetical protein Ciccas_014348, partial [Cichlidogyrus casuarinus]
AGHVGVGAGPLFPRPIIFETEFVASDDLGELAPVLNIILRCGIGLVRCSTLDVVGEPGMAAWCAGRVIFGDGCALSACASPDRPVRLPPPMPDDEELDVDPIESVLRVIVGPDSGVLSSCCILGVFAPLPLSRGVAAASTVYFPFAWSN